MNLQKSGFGMIWWYWVIHINICDVKSDGFWRYLKTDVQAAHLVCDGASKFTSFQSVSPACWGMGNSGRRHDVIKVGQGARSSALNLSHIIEGCWAVVCAGMAIPMFSLFMLHYRSECHVFLFGAFCAGFQLCVIHMLVASCCKAYWSKFL